MMHQNAPFIAVIVAGLTTATAVAIPIPSPSATASTIYRLSEDASYQQGCFPPCLCPIMLQQHVRGTFMLTAVPIDPTMVPPSGFTIQTFTITDVNWTVSLGAPELRITGSGVLTVMSGIIKQDPTMQLQMDLAVGGRPAQHFDSGPVATVSTLPQIDLTISINGMFCHDTAITVSASPVPATQILRYSLVNGSTFQQGCFDPCDCLLMDQQPLRGRFALVPLQTTGAIIEYAVVDARWQILSPSVVTTPGLITGYGVYRRTSSLSLIPPAQQLSLELSVGGDPPAHFDSGFVAALVPFPRIDATVSMHGMVCFDKVIHVVASPRFIVPAATGLVGAGP